MIRPQKIKCTGHSKRTKGPCQGWAVEGRTVCYQHGGASRRGVAHPAYKHGRYVKHLPARLITNYVAARSDKSLLSLRDEIGLIDTRLLDILPGLDSGESGKRWAELQTVWEACESARRSGDMGTVAERLSEVGALIHAGADTAAWDEVRELVQDRRQLVESERKRLVELHQMISVERAMALVARVADAIRRHVTDPATVGKVTQELEAILVQSERVEG